MRSTTILSSAVLLLAAGAANAAEITGDYLEARSCDVYTGPCFANGEMGLAGREAVMAWKVDKGQFQGVSLDGLTAALVVTAENTLGYDGVFVIEPGRVESVLLVDRKATPEQRQALIAFVKDAAPDLTRHIVEIRDVPMELKNDHLSGQAHFRAGDGLAEIRTRGLTKGDCICSNETIFFLPLTKVENYAPAYSLTLSYRGEELSNSFVNHGLRSAFLATFRR